MNCVGFHIRYSRMMQGHFSLTPRKAMAPSYSYYFRERALVARSQILPVILSDRHRAITMQPIIGGVGVHSKISALQHSACFLPTLSVTRNRQRACLCRACRNAQADLWKCVEDADCSFDDDRLQMAVLRDPRAVTVSAYFQLLRQESPRIDEERQTFQSVDTFFQIHLKFVCMWISIRYLLFTVFMADRSAVFWYDEAVADPVDWHRRYLAFVGVHVPADEVVGMARSAGGGGSILGYPSKGIDAHPGGVDEAATSARTFRDELSGESLAMMDDVLRQWLPPVILARLDLVSQHLHA